jgi:hypothetical protein
VVTSAPAPSMRTSVRATGASLDVRTPPEMDRVCGAVAAEKTNRSPKTPAPEHVRRRHTLPPFATPYYSQRASEGKQSHRLRFSGAALVSTNRLTSEPVPGQRPVRRARPAASRCLVPGRVGFIHCFPTRLTPVGVSSRVPCSELSRNVP